MAKDDYFVIAYKVLAYLYVKLKSGEAIEPDFIEHDGKLFKINEQYWIYIMSNMEKQGYIEGLTITRAFGNQVIISDLEYCQITPQGIAYLCDNKFAKKAKEFLKDIKEITPFI